MKVIGSILILVGVLILALGAVNVTGKLNGNRSPAYIMGNACGYIVFAGLFLIFGFMLSRKRK